MMIITGMMTIIMVAGDGTRATGTTVLTALRMITCCRRLRLLQATGEASVMLSELAEDGQSRNNYSFNAEMTFYQAGDKVNSLSGNGVEVDYADDGSNESQTLKFTWYIDKNGDIYIRYNDSGATYVMDAGAKQYGFYLGDERGQDVFYGYMIGTGKAKGDVMQIDLVRYNPSGARKKTRSAATDSVAPSFGKATGRAFMPHAIKKLPRR